MRPDGRVERRADMTKLTVAFRNFANAPKNGCTVTNIYIGSGVNASICAKIFLQLIFNPRAFRNEIEVTV
jgi:hypothetical protein